MDSCNTGDHTAGDYMHTDITTFNFEELQQKCFWNGQRKITAELKNLNFEHCFF